MALVNVLIYEPYPFDRIAGNLRTQSYIMELVNRKRFRLFFLAPFETDFTRKVRREGIETIILEPPKRVNRYGKKCLRDSLGGKVLTALDLFRYNLQLYKVFKTKEIDIIYCNCIRGVLTVGLAAMLRRTPILWYIKGELQNTLLDTIGFFISDRILYFCESNKNDKYSRLLKIFQKKIGILKIGIDPQMVIEVEQSDKSKLARELGIDGQAINCVYIGQIYAPKGIHFLLEAIGIVKEQFPDIRLYIVGDHIIEEYKDYKNKLIKIIEQYKISKHVVFTGWRPDALQIISLMDILIHPSLHEGFGRAVLEGMALGKVVIASKVGGLREIIEDGKNGFLVEPGSSQMIAEKLQLLLQNKDLREMLGREAKRAVFSEYLIEDKILQLEKIWSNMARR